MIEFEPQRQSSKDRQESEEYGGSESFREYEVRDTRGYGDKGNHRESSNFHQPSHQEHWKKEEKKNDRT